MGRGRKRHRRKSAEPVVTPVAAPLVSARPVAELIPVLPEDVEVMWPLAVYLLEPELPNLDSTPEQLAELCAAGGAILWLVCGEGDDVHAAMITVQTPHLKCIVIACCGNNLWDYLEARHQLYAWAKGEGMKEVVFYGRDALVKLMPECKRAGVILRKEL